MTDLSPDRKPTVLLVHNRYQQPGGEERSVADICDLLRSRGHRVQLFERSSRALFGRRGRLRAGIAMVAGGEAPSDVAAAIERTGAEIVHAHNVSPLFGPRSLTAANGAGSRVVMHLHNYRLVCAVAIAYRDGGLCMRCHKRNTVPGVRLRCRGGLAEALAYGAGLSVYQGKALEAVDRFIVPSVAALERLREFGLPVERMTVLPNFLPEGQFARESRAAHGEYALYAGRLSEEKGVDTVIEAARLAGVPLMIAGAGPDAERLERCAAEAPVRFAGHLSKSALAEVRKRAAFAVVPSRWDEPCPYAVIEAMAAGLPVLASNVGGLPEMVGGQSTLPSREGDRWAQAMAELWRDRDSRRDRGEAALARAQELFGAGSFYTGLSEVYARTAGEG